jgi:TolB-like protein
MDESAQIDLSRASAFRLGALTVEPPLRQVTTDTGATETLEPRVLQVLVALVRANRRVVSRNDLTLQCWDGRVVGDDAINRVIARLRRLAETHGGFRIETVSRVGYRLIGDAVQPDPAAAVTPAVDDALPDTAARTEHFPHSRDILPHSATPLDRPSIALLPFASPANAPDQAIFADGMVEEIAIALSRYKSILVVAGGSALALKGRGLMPVEAGVLLGVRYLIDGHVRREADKVRISLHLIEAANGAQIWSERFEGAATDIFALQDEVALRVAGVVEPAIHRVEIARSEVRRPIDMRAHDLYLRAWPLHRSYTQDSTLQALALVLRAVALEPDHAPALMLAAVCATLLDLYGWAEDAPANHALGIEMARRATLNGETDAFVLAHCAFAIAHLERDERAASVLLERAIALNPGCAAVWFMSGLVKVRIGDTDVAADHLERAMRLDPIGPDLPNQIGLLSWARFQQRRFEEAVTLGKEFVRLKRHPRGYAFLAAALGHLGEKAAARDALQSYDACAGQSIEQFAASFILDAENRTLFFTGISAAT